MRLKRCLLGWATCVVVLMTAWPAHAELVFFASGRTLSIKGHRMEGNLLLLLLRSGGEIACDPSMIARIAPDEVPYPEPVVEPPVAAPSTSPPPEPPVAAAVSPQSTPPPYAAIIDRVAAEQ